MDSTTCSQSPVWAYFDKLSNGKAFCKEVLYWFKRMIFLNISSFRGRLAVEELVVLKENRKLLRDFQRNSEYKMSEGSKQNSFDWSYRRGGRGRGWQHGGAGGEAWTLLRLSGGFGRGGGGELICFYQHWNIYVCCSKCQLPSSSSCTVMFERLWEKSFFLTNMFW